MVGINEVTLVGRLGADVAIDKTNVGATPIARGSLACPESYQDKKTREWKEIVDWIQLRFYDKLAEKAVQRLKKGMEVLIKGKIKTWRFVREGKTEYATAVKVEKFLLFKGSDIGGGNAVDTPEPESLADDDMTPF